MMGHLVTTSALTSHQRRGYDPLALWEGLVHLKWFLGQALDALRRLRLRGALTTAALLGLGHPGLAPAADSQVSVVSQPPQLSVQARGASLRGR